MTDEAIIQGFLAGDRESHRQIDAWIAQVLRSRWLSLGHDSEDVAQDVRRRLLAVFRAGGFAGGSTLRTYVWRAAQHAALNALRRRRRKPVEALSPALEPPSHEDDPAALTLQGERRALAQRLLDALGEPCRRLWTLAVFEELPYRVVAERLGISEANVKVRAMRCRRRALELFRSAGPARGPLALRGATDGGAGGS